jgi:hypothetical protein
MASSAQPTRLSKSLVLRPRGGFTGSLLFTYSVRREARTVLTTVSYPLVYHDSEVLEYAWVDGYMQTRRSARYADGFLKRPVLQGRRPVIGGIEEHSS